MNTRYALLVGAMMLSGSIYAQKNELKSLKKIHDKDIVSASDIADFKTALGQAEPLIGGSANEADKVYFNYYKAMVPMLAFGLPENQLNPGNAVKAVSTSAVTEFASAANALLDYEKKTGKAVFTNEIKKDIAAYKPIFLNHAIALVGQERPKDASQLLFAVYKLDPADVDNLYYAASYATNAADYENALAYYYELQKLNYSGEKTVYYAVNIVSDKEESFDAKADRDRWVTLKSHKSPREAKEPSKRGEIYKNIALILVHQGKSAEAKDAIAAARKENPTDTSLMMTEADLYLQLKDYENYKTIVAQILEKNPNDANLVFNLGALSMQAGQLEEAETYFKRAIAIDPNYVNAYVNLSGIILQGDKKFVDEMNKLGTSAAENKRYDQLKAQRSAIFKTAMPYLEKAHNIDPKNDIVIESLLSVYKFLELTDKHNALKAKRG